MRALLLLLLNASVVMGDGQHMLLRKQADSLTVTVFGTPRVGRSEISLLVEDNNRNPMLDADVQVRCGDSSVHAVHGANKLLYTAVLYFKRAGRIAITVRIGATQVSGEIPVEPETPPLIVYWPYFAVVPVAIVLFALNQWLKGNRRVRRLPAPP